MQISALQSHDRHQNFVLCLNNSIPPCARKILQHAAAVHVQAFIVAQSCFISPWYTPQALCLSYVRCAFVLDSSQLLQATAARIQLQDAIMKSHGSHTARWLTETAAICLKHGLTSSTSAGLQLHPIKCTLVTMHIRDVLPELHDVMAKLQSGTGLKYFRLFWASQQQDTVLLRLRDIILVPGQPTALANLLRSIEIVDRPIAAPVNGHVPLSPARMLPPTNKDTPTAAPSTQRFSVSSCVLFGRALLCSRCCVHNN